MQSAFNSLVTNFFKTFRLFFFAFFFSVRIYIFAKYLEVSQGILVHGYFSYELWPLAQLIHAFFFHGNQNLEFGSLPVGPDPEHNNLGGGKKKELLGN